MVNTIEIVMGGKPRQLRFDQFTLEAFFKKVDYDAFAASSRYAATYGAMKSFDFSKGRVSDYTWEDVFGWVNEMSPEDLKRVKDSFEEMEEYKKTVEGLTQALTELSPDETKKKSLMPE